MYQKNQTTNYIVLDLETTGLHPHQSAITEIAAIKFDGNQVLDSFHTLINPQRTISAGITRLTGITNAMVADAPFIQEVMPLFQDFLQGDIIVGHNVSFDFRFLNHYHYLSFQEYLNNETICTMKLARRYLSSLPNKKLMTVCEYLGIENSQAHRAMSDARATLEVFQYFLQKEEGI